MPETIPLNETPAQRQIRIEAELQNLPPLPRTPKRLQKNPGGESLGETVDRRSGTRYRNNNNFNNHS
ncbi:MAG: hypothetical protein WC784_04080 [Candidatus Shapirobacteria bacterium]|jgi:hypothetical protein